MAGNRNSGRRPKIMEKALIDKQRQWREAIETTKILKRLQAYVLSQEQNGKRVEMDPGQITAAIALLKKALPDLTQATIDGNVTVTHEDEIDAILKHPYAVTADEIGKTAGNA